MNHNNRIEFLPREDLITSEDAKRLVACWNACIGIDTKLLKPRMLAEHDAYKDLCLRADRMNLGVPYGAL